VSTSVFGCGLTDIRIERGEIYAPLIRILMSSADPAGLLVEQFLIAEYRFGPP
jgi:hypothetical protein